MTLEEMQLALEELRDDKEVLELNVTALEEELGELEVFLLETFAKAPGVIMSPAIDYRAIYSDAETVVSRLTLGQLPVVKIYTPDTGEAPLTVLAGYAVRKLPNISPTLL